MLRQLQNIQLGLRYDVHSSGFHSQRLYIHGAGCFIAAAYNVGDISPQISRTLFRAVECMSFLRNVQGETLPSQKAAQKLFKKT